ncbi:thioredoxin family protein [Pirellulaceae bacterium SH501]
MAIIAGAVAITIRQMPRLPLVWKAYTSASLQEAFDDKQSVLISLSANWCISGTNHERTATNSATVIDAIRDNGLQTLRADLTNLDPAAVQLAKDTGLDSVPAFIIYNPGFPSDPIVLKDFVSEKQLLDAIRYNSQRSKHNGMDAKGSIDAP